LGVIIVPEKTLEKLNKNILPQWKICFFTAVLVGLLAHLYKITGWIPNWDSLVFRYDAQNMVSLGRWFLPVVCSFSSFYDLPFLNGIIAIIFHALGAVFVCRTLNVQRKTTAFLIGAVIVSFPTVTSVMMYNYVADGYSIAFFLSVLAAFYMTKEKPKYLFSVICIALSAGIYQAYITVTIMLSLIKLIDEIICDDATFRVIFKKCIYMLLTGLIGMILYSIVLKAVLYIFSIELLEYQGISSVVAHGGLDLIGSLYVIKETFIKCFFDLTEGVNIYVVLNGFALVSTIVYTLTYVVKKKIYKKPAISLILVVLAALTIIGAGALAFVNTSIDYHNLMLMGYSVFYLFFIILYERGTKTSEKHTKIKCWIILITSLLIISNQIVIANVSYHKAQMAYEKSFGVLIRITDRIEQTPGAEECDKIMVVGALDNSHAYSVNLTPDITGITDGYIIRADDEVLGQSVFCSTINDYCDKNYTFLAGEEKKALMMRDEVKAMEEWPAKSCVAVVDDTVVIKLGAEGEK